MAQWLKCWSEDGKFASHGTVQLRLRKPSNAPQGQRIGGYGSVLRRLTQQKLNLACRKSVEWRDPGPRGLWARSPGGLGPGAPRAWGPAHQGPGAFSPQKPPNLSRFFRKPPGGSLAKAWVSAETAASEVGTWRETKPGYPPYPPPPPAFWGCKGERKRVFTLSAFGNHPTRPPRSADNPIESLYNPMSSHELKP